MMMMTLQSLLDLVTEVNVVTVLTAGAILLNVWAACRALSLAQDIESNCNWVCRTVGNDCVIRTLQGLATVCLILAVLKSWSVLDIFSNYWYQMSETYHIRAFAYLGENYGVGMLGHAVINVFKRMTKCKTAERYSNLQKSIDKIGV